MDSILTSVKKLLGIEAEYTHFDQDIIIGINSAIMSLTLLGVGPTNGFLILGNTEKWVDLLGDSLNMESVKMYIYLKTKLMFDPPTNAFVVDAIERQIKEVEWRINIQAETNTTVVEGGTVIE